MVQKLIKIITGLALLLTVAACAPTVKVAAPDKPITINLNVKIEHEIRVKVDKDLDDLMTKDSGLF
jgi:YnbE-like lipoprotein